MKAVFRELRHLYGALILFFYYMKWPILIGWPLLYFYLDFEDNLYMDILWAISLVLALKDIALMFVRFKKGERLWR